MSFDNVAKLKWFVNSWDHFSNCIQFDKCSVKRNSFKTKISVTKYQKNSEFVIVISCPPPLYLYIVTIQHYYSNLCLFYAKFPSQIIKWLGEGSNCKWKKSLNNWMLLGVRLNFSGWSVQGSNMSLMKKSSVRKMLKTKGIENVLCRPIAFDFLV